MAASLKMKRRRTTLLVRVSRFYIKIEIPHAKHEGFFFTDIIKRLFFILRLKANPRWI